MTDTVFTLYRDVRHGTADIGAGNEGSKKQAFGLSLCAEDVLFWRNISLSVVKSVRNPRPFLKEEFNNLRI